MAALWSWPEKAGAKMARPNSAQQKRRRAERQGRRAEWLAAWRLRLKGYRILEQRFKLPFGEIDIVARRGQLIVFVEVKARRDLETALTSITEYQRCRIVRAADAWLAREAERGRLPDSYDISFDMVLVVPGRIPYHYSGQFDAN